jgi:hypothetical protein
MPFQNYLHPTEITSCQRDQHNLLFSKT